jgi:hypothetical protein
MGFWSVIRRSRVRTRLEESMATPEELKRKGRLVEGRINGGPVSAPVSQEQIEADRYPNPLARGVAKLGFPNTANAIQGGGEDVSDAYGQGGLLSAIGAGARGLLGTVAGYGADGFSNFGKGGIPPSSPAAPKPASATAPASGGADPYTVPQAGDGSDPYANLYATPGWTKTSIPGVIRKGNAFTNIPGNVPANIGFDAVAGASVAAPKTPAVPLGLQQALSSLTGGLGSGSVSASSRTGPRFSVIGDSSADDRERQALISAASTPYKGSPNGQLTANQLRVLAGIRDSEGKNALARETTTVNNAAGIEREQLQQQGANQRAVLGAALQWPESQERAVGLGINNRLAAQKEGALNNYMNAQTPEARNKALQQLQALGGGGNMEENLRNRFMTVAETDVDGYKRERIVDLQALANGQPGTAAQAQPEPVDKEVYVDAQGNRARWDGKNKKYVPV